MERAGAKRKLNRIIITGATSMMGGALIEACAKRGTEVLAVVRGGSEKIRRIADFPNVQIVECELNRVGELPDLMRHGAACFDAFYHFAWAATGADRNKSARMQADNIGWTLDALHAAKELGCGLFVGAGSQAEYGTKGPDVLIGPDTETQPDTPYGICKLAAGQLAFAEAAKIGIDCIWPRIFSVYGIWEKESAMIASALRAARTGAHMAFTSAEQIWDYLYSRDAGEAFYRIGESGIPGRIYCVASGQSRPLRTYLEEIYEEIGQPLKGLGERPDEADAMRNLNADIGSLTEDTGFLPVYSFREGIRETLKWMEGNEV